MPSSLHQGSCFNMDKWLVEFLAAFGRVWLPSCKNVLENRVIADQILSFCNYWWNQVEAACTHVTYIVLSIQIYVENISPTSGILIIASQYIRSKSLHSLPIGLGGCSNLRMVPEQEILSSNWCSCKPATTHKVACWEYWILKIVEMEGLHVLLLLISWTSEM